MDITQLDSELRAKKIRPVYILKGPERHLIQTAKKQILKGVLTDVAEKPDTFLAGKTPIHQILDCLRTPSILSPWRVVVVEEVEEWKKEDWEALQDYWKGKLENQTLILIGESIRAPYLKGVPSPVAIFDFKKLYPNQIASWINMEVRSMGLNISREGAQFLVDCVGSDCGSLYQALEKLNLFVGARRLVQLEDVEKVVANTAQKSIFDLTKAVGEKNQEKAFRLLKDILEQGEEPIRVLAMITRHFRILARAQELLSRGVTGLTFAQQLKTSPFFAQEYAAQAKRLNPGGWKRRFATLYATERSLKSSRQAKERILEKLAWELFSPTY